MSNLQSVDWSAIPAPEDDGATAHLAGMTLPSVPLMATSGEAVDLSTLSGLTVVYAYPRTGEPGQSVPAGWDAVPGARGCTPQSCAFRDHHAELQALGVDHLFGLSTQDTAYQQAAVERLHLPFALLSDEALALSTALRLPTFSHEINGTVQTLIKRLSLIIRDGRIEQCLYPVFPPNRNAEAVIELLKSGS
tara:strand:+ start:997 stop:1572 length:576 start_codon:yes stop_codon:yes gene_type:complete